MAPVARHQTQHPRAAPPSPRLRRRAARGLADTEHLDAEADEVRAWAQTAGIRVEHMTALPGDAGDDAAL